MVGLQPYSALLRTTQPAPPPVPGIEWKEWLKLSGITFHEDPCNWDLHVDSLLSRAASRLAIKQKHSVSAMATFTSYDH